MTRSIPNARALSCRAFLAALCLALALPAAAHAQRSKKGGGYNFFGGTNGVAVKNSPKFLALFRTVIVEPARSTVRVRLDDKDFGLGVVVGAEGYVLTQATDQEGTYSVQLRDGKALVARLVGVQKAHNLALLKVEAGGLSAVKWAHSKDAPAGSWVASVGMGAEPAAVGVVSVATRNIPGAAGARRTPVPTGGFLGIGLADEGPGAIVGEVMPNTAAARAGLKVNDVILSVSGRKTGDAETLVRTLGRHKPGESVVLKVRRGEGELELKAKLGKRTVNSLSRGDFQNSLGGELSEMRSGFPVVLQHDSVVRPQDCGGPLVDLDGNVVGVNISRAGRTETWAVPAEVIRSILPDLLAGRLAPKQKSGK